MTPLNVDVPSEMMDRIKLAKVLTKTPIRHIALEALEDWLTRQGITPDKLAKLRPEVPPARKR